MFDGSSVGAGHFTPENMWKITCISVQGMDMVNNVKCYTQFKYMVEHKDVKCFKHKEKINRKSNCLVIVKHIVGYI